MMLRKKSKISAAVANGGSGSGSKSRSVGVSRKPFSDFSNLNLIPTDVLRQLCSNSISATEAQTILAKYQTPGIQFQGNSYSSKSDTSIGSSNFNTVAKRNGLNQLPRSSPSSVKNDEDCELVMLGEKKNVINLEKFDKVSSDKGKPVCMPMRTTRASLAKNKQKEATLALDSTLSADKHVVSPSSVKHVVSPSSLKHVVSPLSVKPVVSPVKPVVLPSSAKPVQKMNDKAEVSISEKTKDKGKAPVISYDKTKDKGKAVAMPWSSLSEQTVDNGKPKLLKDSFRAASTHMQRLNQKTNATAGSSKVDLSEKSKATVVSFSAGTYDKIKDKGKAVLSEQAVDEGKSKLLKDSFLAASTPVQKHNQKAEATAGSSKVSLSEKSKASVVSFSTGKDTGKAVATSSSSLSKHEKGKGSSTEMVEQKKSRGGVVSASSCPPVRRKRNTRDDLSEDGDTRSGAWTDPHPKLKKVKCENSYPEEFIKQQKAYFQEIDDFELEVEEV